MSPLIYLTSSLSLGSLTLRAGKPCLTQTQLDAISNEDVADFHPLNCAKMNAKPFPYFDGGVCVSSHNTVYCINYCVIDVLRMLLSLQCVDSCRYFVSAQVWMVSILFVSK